MKNIRKPLIATAALSILAVTAIAFAQPGGSSTKFEARIARHFIANVEARLNITTEQRTQVKTILKTEEPTILALAAQAKQEREAMTSLPAYNESAVRDIAQKYAATNTDIVVERAKVRLELRGVLTEQQLQQIEQFKSDFDGHFDERLDMAIGQI